MPQFEVQCTRILETYQRATVIVEAEDEDAASDLVDKMSNDGEVIWIDDDESIPEGRDEDFEAYEYKDEAEANAGTDADPGL